jgi:hypothetical protein
MIFAEEYDKAWKIDYSIKKDWKIDYGYSIKNDYNKGVVKLTLSFLVSLIFATFTFSQPKATRT